MNKKGNVIWMFKNRDVKSYTDDYAASKELANRIMQFWHDKGYKYVKAWVESETKESGRREYSVRSNIIFKVNSLFQDS